MRHILLLLFAGFLLAPFHAAAALSPAARGILEDARKLAIDSDSDVARKALEARPRAEVVQAFREGLKEGEPSAGLAAAGAAAVGFTELLPDLKKIAAASDNWKVFAVLRSLSSEREKETTTKFLLSRLHQVSEPSQVAILAALGSWEVPLSDASFSKLLIDRADVKRAALESFFLARKNYSNEQQIAHFKTAFSIQPYQLRLDSMAIFMALPPADRAKLARAVDPGLCAKEANAEVKPVCENLVHSVRP